MPDHIVEKSHPAIDIFNVFSLYNIHPYLKSLLPLELITPI